MFKLNSFDVRGEDILDDDEVVIRNGDPHRNLVRYRPDGSELFVSTRINVPLLRTAVSLPIMLLKPVSHPDEIMLRDGLLTPEGSDRNFGFLEDFIQVTRAEALPACYLAQQHGDSRRDFYFLTEDVVGFTTLAQSAAQKFAFPLTVERFSLAEVAPTILPREAVGEIGLVLPARERIQLTRFEFWGADSSLQRLRIELERRGYRFLSLQAHLRELRMVKETPIDKDFQTVLKQIVPLSRSLQCSYRGTETVDGSEQFLLTRPLPERYSGAGAGFLSRKFGRN